MPPLASTPFRSHPEQSMPPRQESIPISPARSSGSKSPGWTASRRGRRELLAVALFCLAIVVVPLCRTELYPFSRALPRCSPMHPGRTAPTLSSIRPAGHCRSTSSACNATTGATLPGSVPASSRRRVSIILAPSHRPRTLSGPSANGLLGKRMSLMSMSSRR